MSLRRFPYAAALTVFLANIAQAQIPQSERDALIALYNNTNGAHWTDSTAWNGAPGTECAWFGITCDSASAAVTGIDLNSNGLAGNLSPLTACKSLRTLNFRFNSLTGPIPALSGLTSLQNFDFGDNQFSGQVPSLQGLTSLQVFSVELNQLTGPIPSLSGLPSLVYVNVQYNQLSGPIPALAGLPGLQNFSAAANSLSGTIPALTGLAALNNFDVAFNDLQGNIPSLGGLAQLQALHVDYNHLSGPLPALTGLTSLQVFAAEANQLSGTIPPLSEAPKLEDFEVFDNQLNGEIPSLSGLSSLVHLSVGSNQLSGQIPSLAGLTALERFEVDTNKLSGSIPALSGSTALTRVTAYSNQLSGPIPSLSGLSALVTFDVDTNQLTGSLPSLSGLTALKDFEAYSNNLSGAIPALSGLTALETFSVHDNQLTGSLPVLAGSPALVFFRAEENRLSGSLPSLSGLTRLQEFRVASNQLSGPIPSLAGLTVLDIFDVSANRLTGTLPSLAGLNELYAFRVGNNQLSGALTQVSAGLANYHSSLCPNALTPTPDPAWDAATGESPWYTMCTIAQSTNGAPTSKDSTRIVLSRDGAIKVFQSLQTDLTANTANAGGQDIYSVGADGKPVLESVDSAGNKLIGTATLPAVSADGNVIAFLFTPSAAKSRKEFLTGQMFAGARGQPKHQVDMGMGGAAPNGAANGSPSLSSANGINQLVFCSSASNLVPSDGNSARDIFLVDPLNAAIAAQRISIDGAGKELVGDSCEPSLAGDGTKLVFSLSAPSLFGTSARQIVFKDLGAAKILLTGQLLPITASATGQGADTDSSEPVINHDGSVIAFTSQANLDGIGAPAGGREVFIALANAGGRLIRRARSGDGTIPNGASQHPQLSGDGTAVAVQTAATNFLQFASLAKETAAAAPFQCGAVAITTNFFSVAALGGPLCANDGTTANQSPSISDDGTTTGFDSNAPQANGNTNRNAYAQGIGTYTGVTGTKLPNLSGDYSGQWFDPSQNGQGLVIDVTNPDANNDRLLLLTWFVFVNGQPTWVQGVGTPHAGTGSDANTVVVQMDQVAIFQGASFPLGQARATPSLWGSIWLTFTDANTGTMNWRSTYPGFNSGSMPIKHFVAVGLPENDAVTAPVKSCYSGNWFNPAQSGHGFEFEILPTTPAFLTVDWFAFAPSGAPVWLQGAGPISGNSAQMHLQLIDGAGAQFPPNYHPGNITQHDWGTATFTFTDESHASVAWDSTIAGYGSGSQLLQPLAKGLIDRRACQ
jgi:Leucine-rich repeat (LRR) protein